MVERVAPNALSGANRDPAPKRSERSATQAFELFGQAGGIKG